MNLEQYWIDLLREVIDTPGFSSFDAEELDLELKAHLAESFLEFRPETRSIRNGSVTGMAAEATTTSWSTLATAGRSKAVRRGSIYSDGEKLLEQSIVFDVPYSPEEVHVQITLEDDVIGPPAGIFPGPGR